MNSTYFKVSLYWDYKLAKIFVMKEGKAETKPSCRPRARIGNQKNQAGLFAQRQKGLCLVFSISSLFELAEVEKRINNHRNFNTRKC